MAIAIIFKCKQYFYRGVQLKYKNNDEKLVNFKAGEIIIQEKKDSDSIYIVKSGQLQAYKSTSSGEKIPLGIINSGEYIGEMSFFLDNYNTANVAALSDTVLIKISKDYCNKFLKTLPPWFTAMIKGQAHRLNKANDILRRNDIVDDSLATSVKAIEDKNEKPTD